MQVLIVVVSKQEALDELCDYMYKRISEIRTECRYDYDDFKDHISGLMYPVQATWVFDCISNFTFIHPQKCSHMMKL